MKIDKQKLIDLLAEKTAMDPKEIETQLNQLVARIQDAADKGKALDIKGFGMFYLSESGDLKFDPSEELQTEVNYKYTGMEPVEIKKPRESADSSSQLSAENKPESSEVEQDQDKVDNRDLKKAESKSEQDKIDSEAAAKQEEEEIEPSGKDVEKKDQTEKKSEEAYDPFAGFDHGFVKTDDDSGSEDKESKKEPKPDEPVSDEKPADVQGKSEKTVADKPKAVPEIGAKSEKKTYNRPEKKKRNPVSIIIAAIVGILVIVIGIIVASELGIFGSSVAPQEFAQDQSQPVSPPADSPDAGTETDSDLDTEPDPEEQVEPQDAPGAQEQPELTPIEEGEVPSFGLYGTPLSIDGRYYSIILHSIRSENRADEIREELQDQGYRAVISSVNSEEYGTMWRIGIGQFESISNAQDAASELPQNYRDNHFIGLLQ